MNPTGITYHETGNTSVGADAKAHANYISGGSGGRKVSWHYSVDDGDIVYQHLEEDQVAYHTGTAAGNNTQIGIEICVNQGIDTVRARRNAARLGAQILHRRGWGINQVTTHKRWSGKNCPRTLLPHWASFIRMIEQELAALRGTAAKPAPVVIPAPPTATPLLRAGAQGEAVKRMQLQLIRHGHRLTKFGADGHFGDETLRAVRAFQGSRKLVVDGIVGPATWAALNSAAPAPAPPSNNKQRPTIRRNARGADVKYLQTRLLYHGEQLPKFGVDSHFGAETEAAVKRFQRRKKIGVDGIVGPQTWQRIDASK